ncbi:LWR-salt protein [Salinirubrum litoreum]|uniref:LWR-salt protein n=1 Tax=Salinirubrum litoreum TaxID=1126234 RepID=A0ABD5RFB2_9EURY|nr:LWR-salt protein [Salinirubrum litoreum]
MHAEYVFRVRFRLAPEGGVSVAPAEFETVLRVPAVEPGDPDDEWLFFRDNCWRGEVADERHLRDRAEELLGVPVVAVTFSELATDEAYLDALKAAIAEDVDQFGDDTASRVLTTYLGSSIRVVDDEA